MFSFFYFERIMNYLLSLVLLSACSVILYFITRLLKELFTRLLVSRIPHISFILSIVQICLIFTISYFVAIWLGFTSETILTIATTGATLASFFVNDTIENALSGITIFTDKLFQVGDFIKINDYEGIVEQVTLTKTYLTTTENEKIVIDNKVVTKSILINRSQNKVYRAYIKIPIKQERYDRISLKGLFSETMAAENQSVPEELNPTIELFEATSNGEIWKIEFNAPSSIDIDEFKSTLLLTMLTRIDEELT